MLITPAAAALAFYSVRLGLRCLASRSSCVTTAVGDPTGTSFTMTSTSSSTETSYSIKTSFITPTITETTASTTELCPPAGLCVVAGLAVPALALLVALRQRQATLPLVAAVALEQAAMAVALVLLHRQRRHWRRWLSLVACNAGVAVLCYEALWHRVWSVRVL